MKNYVGNEVVHVSKEGITVVRDSKFEELFGGIALTEVSMGYGIHITKEGCIRSYANNKEALGILNRVWDIFEEPISEAFFEAEGIGDYVDMSISILVNVTKGLRKLENGGEEDLIA